MSTYTPLLRPSRSRGLPLPPDASPPDAAAAGGPAAVHHGPQRASGGGGGGGVGRDKEGAKDQAVSADLLGAGGEESSRVVE